MSEENKDRYTPGGYHPVHIGDVFNGRYFVKSKLGWGSYSTVWLAQDLSTSPRVQHVALKINIAETAVGGHERRILRTLKEDKSWHGGKHYVLHMEDDFEHQGPNGKHICIVYKLMGRNLREMREYFPKGRISVVLGRQVATQALSALDWLHDTCGIIHCDLKPENTLLELSDPEKAVQNYLPINWLSEESVKQEPWDIPARPVTDTVALTDDSKIHIRLSDFGLSSRKEKRFGHTVGTLGYRAPEIFLHAPWDTAADVWSFACMMYYLIQGVPLFRIRKHAKLPRDQDEILQFVRTLGPVPESLRAAGKASDKYFRPDGKLISGEVPKEDRTSVKQRLAKRPNPSMSARDYENFEKFLTSMLQYDPKERPTAKQLLSAPWLTELREYLDRLPPLNLGSAILAAGAYIAYRRLRKMDM